MPPSCPCGEYMEFGRHDPLNHLPKRGNDVPPLPPAEMAGVRAAAAAADARVPRDEAWLIGLRETLAEEGRKATFTCGGCIPIVLKPNVDESGMLTPKTGAKVQEQRVLAKPLTVCWGPDGSHQGLRASDLCALKGKDVLDESYRRAGALGMKDFVIDFCPYEAGIIDLVTQMLLPPVVGDLDPNPSRRSDDAIKHDLTDANDQRVKYAIGYESHIWVNDEKRFPLVRLGDCLRNLDVPISQQTELYDTWSKLDPHHLGHASRDAVYAVIAERLHAKYDAEAKASGVPRVRPSEAERKLYMRGLRAELYKLNPHVDTPRSASQVGSLVVCFPVDFQGGALAVRHQGHEVAHDWATSTTNDEPSIQWAAFYSDCEHEVLPVTSGHRMTLTYNLFLAPGSGLLAGRAISLQPKQLPMYRQLKSMLDTATVLPKGGYLGFQLQHSYPHTHRKSHHFVPKMLKGADFALYEAAHAAGLVCCLAPVENRNLFSTVGVLQFLDDECSSMNHDHFAHPNSSHTPPSHLHATEIDEYQDEDERFDSESVVEEYGDPDDFETQSEKDAWEADVPDRLRVTRQRMLERDRIIWAKSGAKCEEMSKVALAYGNQAELKVRYSSVALIVKVPSAAARSGQGTVDDPVMLDV